MKKTLTFFYQVWYSANTMFTGLIQSVARVSEVLETDTGKRFIFEADFEPEIGESVAVDGVCLTSVGGSFDADVMPETLGMTTLDNLEPGTRVNLERALKVGDRLGGHFVQGHVDGVGTVLKIEDGRVEITPPLPLLKYIAHKGSIAVNGVSLTVSKVRDDAFEVALIPHTLESTNLSDLQIDSKVNLEVDMMARYLEKLNL
jgi:riboflavin synthase